MGWTLRRARPTHGGNKGRKAKSAPLARKREIIRHEGRGRARGCKKLSAGPTNRTRVQAGAFRPLFSPSSFYTIPHGRILAQHKRKGPRLAKARPHEAKEGKSPLMADRSTWAAPRRDWRLIETPIPQGKKCRDCKAAATGAIYLRYAIGTLEDGDYEIGTRRYFCEDHRDLAIALTEPTLDYSERHLLRSLVEIQ